MNKTIKRRFQVVSADVSSSSTNFTITDLGHENSDNLMSSECFFHHLGELCGKRLHSLVGLTFDVIIHGDPREQKEGFDPLLMCGKNIQRFVNGSSKATLS